MPSKQQIDKTILSIGTLQDEIDENLTDHFGNLEIILDEAGLKDIPQIKDIFENISDYNLKISIGLKKLQRLLARIKNLSNI